MIQKFKEKCANYPKNIKKYGNRNLLKKNFTISNSLGKMRKNKINIEACDSKTFRKTSNKKKSKSYLKAKSKKKDDHLSINEENN